MRILVGSDHAGLALKRAVVTWLIAQGHRVHDVGTESEASTDYPDWAHRLSRALLAGEGDRGVLVCGTGHGMAISANKVHGIRAACVLDTFSARMVAAHNDCNVLCLGERTTGPGLACELVSAWLATSFEGGRHARRVAKMDPDTAAE